MTCLWAVACGELDQPPGVYPDPVAELGGRYVDIRLVEPEPWSTVSSSAVELAATVEALNELTTVELRVDDGAWEPLRVAGDQYRLPITLRRGWNDLLLRATDIEGRVGHLATQVYYEGDDPVLRLRQPAESGWAGVEIAVKGEADAAPPATLQGVVVWVRDGASAAAVLHLDGTFEATVPSGGDGAPELCARATDSEGRTVEICRRLVTDDGLPEIQLEEPTPGAITTEHLITVRGTVSDDIGVERVEVQVDDAGWIIASGTDSFTATVTLPRGASSVQVRAFDVAGNERQIAVDVFSARVVTLRTRDASGTAQGSLLTMTLDKAGLAALVPPADAASIRMLYLDVRGLLVESLRAMRDYDLYGMDTSTWGPAEWSMQRILTMTPDTADVSGTSLENILGLSESLGLPPAAVLANLADIAPTDPFLTLEQVADGIFEDIIEPHPGLAVDPADGVKKIPVTLGDVLDDLVGLADTLGPSPPHPGILFEPSLAPVLLPNFQMTVTARSSLRQHDGIDLRSGKAYLFAAEPGAEILEFDFLNPEWFSAEGIADEPEVDLNFLIVEHPTFVSAGTTQLANPDGIFYRGDSPVWDLDTWTFEYLVADMMYEVYHDRFAATGYARTFSYDIGALANAAVIDWWKGWVVISTVGGLGAPPPPQYLWDAVLELGQVRLHDGGLAEGDADLHLALSGVRVPLTSEQMVESTRPVLETQKATMAQVMVGDHSSYDSTCDLFLKAGDDGELYLFFVHPDDRPGRTQSHPRPGLFADVELATKVSTTADLGSGDATHEKVRVSATGGEVYFAQDLDGSVWQLTMLPAEGDGAVGVRLQPTAGWP